VYYFLQHQVLPCLLSRETHDELKLRSPYFFGKSSDEVMGGARFKFHIIDQTMGESQFCGFPWQFVFYEQSGMRVTGYRIGNFAYIMDLKKYSDEIFEALQGVEALVLSGLRQTESKAHLSLDQALEFARKVGAKQTWFSHVSHEMDHQKGNQLLPRDAQLAYDGLEIPIVC
jgi:phosphoribosyl 1,2-cyclic phosphate phosphodiesterase